MTRLTEALDRARTAVPEAEPSAESNTAPGVVNDVPGTWRFEEPAHVRADARLKDIPIIMITSRAGDKHRARAIEIGVDDYLGKPYQEAQLLEAIEPLVSKRRAPAVASGAGRRR